MNGGRAKWLNERDKKLTTKRPNPKSVPYQVTETHPELRALLPDVLQGAKCRGCNLVDVRSPDEFSGKVIAPPGMNETAQRGGHVPGAKSIPWSTPVAPDGTFKSADELRRIYLEQKGSIRTGRRFRTAASASARATHGLSQPISLALRTCATMTGLDRVRLDDRCTHREVTREALPWGGSEPAPGQSSTPMLSGLLKNWSSLRSPFPIAPR
jgi:hypothetical protein